MINKNERLVSGQGAGVAEHGQSRTKHEKGLYARDSRSRLLGVREFKSHPLHLHAIAFVYLASTVAS